ncbi:MAG: hypothetical protein WBB26_14800 [Saprospiraceae bacterium]
MTYEQLTKAKELETRVKALLEIRDNKVLDKANSTRIQDDRKQFDVVFSSHKNGYEDKVKITFDDSGVKSDLLTTEAKNTLKMLTEMYLQGIKACLEADIDQAEKAFSSL